MPNGPSATEYVDQAHGSATVEQKLVWQGNQKGHLKEAGTGNQIGIAPFRSEGNRKGHHGVCMFEESTLTSSENVCLLTETNRLDSLMAFLRIVSIRVRLGFPMMTHQNSDGIAKRTLDHNDEAVLHLGVNIRRVRVPSAKLGFSKLTETNKLVA